jgi:hypothetical protein
MTARLAVAASTFALACSGSSPTPPAAIAFGQLAAGPDPVGDDATSCDVAFSITPPGTSTNVDDPVYDGQTIAGERAHVRCSIQPTGDAFAVDTTVAVGVATTFSLAGTFAGAASDLRATFTSAGVTYSATEPCSLSFAPNVDMGIYPGKMWALAICPHVRDAAGHTCYASAELMFEYCSE